MNCTGTTNAKVDLDAAYFRQFQRYFTGVQVTASNDGGCLITIYSGPTAGTIVLRNSSVVGVPAIPDMHTLVCVKQENRLEVYNSRFYNNQLRPLAVFDRAQVMLHASRIEGNGVDGWGGGLYLEGAAAAVITTGSLVQGNNASGGGRGVHVRDSARVEVDGGSSISGNTAQSGGGLQAWGKAAVFLTGGSTISRNSAESGGGLHVQENASVSLSAGSSVQGNNASEEGGGVSVKDNARVVVDGGSSISGNTANSGGGVQAWGNAVVSLTGGSSVHGNTARLNGGGLVVMVAVPLTTTNGSKAHSNTANGFGGGLSAADSAQVTINSSTLFNNTAGKAGGGISALDNASVTLADGSRISDNRARNGSGGGLDVSGGATLDIREGCSITNNSCMHVGVGGGIAVGLSVDGLQFVGTGRLDGAAASVGRGTSNATAVISNSTIANNTSHHQAGGGLAVVSQPVVRLIDGTKVVGDTAIDGSGGAVMVMGSASFEADSTVVFARNSVPRGYVGSTIVAFDSSKLMLPSHGAVTKCNSSVYLSRTPCGKGELLQHDVCNCCPSHTFGFANSSCTKCPAYAVCPGASIVEPLPGFWKSSPTSIQMHRCPLFKTACNCLDQDRVCKPGYEGPLCGACKLPEYGMLSPMRCGRCMRAAVQLFLYLLVSFSTVLVVNYTIHATWKGNIQGGREIYVTDYIKVLVQFLQYLVIIGSVSVPWPLFDVQQWLQAIGIVVTLGSGQAISLDCWLYNYVPHGRVPIAIQRQLVYFLTPVFALAFVLALQWLSWAIQRWVFCKPRGRAAAHSPLLLLRKLPVTVLVLVVYAYPAWTRASLSFFACVGIDKPLSAFDEVPEGATAPLSHKWGYWASAITQQCFAGYHLGWSMGLGLPSVLFWCVGVPVAMGVGLYLCRDRADSDSFREHFGFLYRTYRPERMWWEAVWAARTVVLTLISVFAFPMQRYYSVLSLLLVFWVSAALQNVFKPYEFVTLHRMHLVSTSCLAATTLGALAMFAYDIEESTANGLRIAITVLVFVINLTFVGWCCVNLAPALKEWYVDTVAAVKAWGRDFVAHGLRRASKKKYAEQHDSC